MRSISSGSPPTRRPQVVYFEINADPDRLDLSADHVRAVAAAGVKIAINTHAHCASGLAIRRRNVLGQGGGQHEARYDGSVLKRRRVQAFCLSPTTDNAVTN